jgi:hypothetical protein
MDFMRSVKVILIPFLGEEYRSGHRKRQKQREQSKQTFTATAVIEGSKRRHITF